MQSFLSLLLSSLLLSLQKTQQPMKFQTHTFFVPVLNVSSFGQQEANQFRMPSSTCQCQGSIMVALCLWVHINWRLVNTGLLRTRQDAFIPQKLLKHRITANNYYCFIHKTKPMDSRQVLYNTLSTLKCTFTDLYDLYVFMYRLWMQ